MPKLPNLSPTARWDVLQALERMSCMEWEVVRYWLPCRCAICFSYTPWFSDVHTRTWPTMLVGYYITDNICNECWGWTH